MPQQRRISEPPAAEHSAAAVAKVSLNAVHDLEAVLQCLADWAREVFQAHSRSAGDSVDIALGNRVHVVRYDSCVFAGERNSCPAQVPNNGSTTNLDPIANGNIDFE